MKRSFIVSMLLHALGLFLLWNGWPISLQSSRDNEVSQKSLKVRTVSEKSLQQMVQIDTKKVTLPKERNEKEEVFLAKKDQFAEKNTLAKNIGKFQNFFQVSPRSQMPEEGLTEFPQEKEQNTDRGPAQSDDYVEGAESGDQTLLNTREFKYMSFFERLREKVAERWKAELQSQIFSTYTDSVQLFKSGQEQLRSDLRIVLGTRGEIIDIEIWEGSGVRQLDQVAKEAFEKSAPFHNPPKGLLNKESQVEIRWLFVLQKSDGGVNVHLERYNP